MSNNYLMSVTGCSAPVRTNFDQALQKKFNTTNCVENYAPGVSGCAAPVRTKFDQALQKKFGPSQENFRRKTRILRENFRTKAFDDPDNRLSYKINYAPLR